MSMCGGIFSNIWLSGAWAFGCSQFAMMSNCQQFCCVVYVYIHLKIWKTFFTVKMYAKIKKIVFIVALFLRVSV